MDSVDYNKIIGSNIRFERQKRDLTIEELSEILNIAPGFLGLIERGQRGTSIKNLCKIAKFFSISLDQLITCPAGTPVKSGKELVAEKAHIALLKDKHNTAVSLIHGLSTIELDFIISSIKGMRKLIKKNEDIEARELKSKNKGSKDFDEDDIDAIEPDMDLKDDEFSETENSENISE